MINAHKIYVYHIADSICFHLFSFSSGTRLAAARGAVATQARRVADLEQPELGSEFVMQTGLTIECKIVHESVCFSVILLKDAKI